VDGALPLRFGIDGAWLGATPEAVEREAASDPALLASLSAEIDRIEAQGERSRTLARLVEIEQLSSDPLILGWALSTRAALHDAAGERSAGDLARRDLIARAPTARDAHGLLRAFVARLMLSEVEAEPKAARLALYADASADYRELGESATAEFLRRLREQLGSELKPTDARLTAIDRLDASRSHWRLWWGSLRRGITDWVARGASGERAVFASVAAPIPSANPLSMEAPQAAQRAGGLRFVASLQREGDGWVGQALPLALLVDRALAAQLVDGAQAAQEFGVNFETKLAAPAGGALELVASHELPPPLQEYVIAVRGGDFAAFLAGERRRILFVSLAVALAILVAALAAWLSLRAVSREVEAARGREEFVAAVTHELKTPLATIRLFAEMLQRGDVEEHPRVFCIAIITRSGSKGLTT
jgi:signal transduction histidine kinase